jgi:hypothetical protein
MGQIMPPPTFFAYHAKVFRKVAQEARGLWWSAIVPLVIAVVIAVLQGKFALIRTDQTWSAAFVNAAPYAALLVGYLFFHFMRAPWKLDRERHTEIARLQQLQDCIKASGRLEVVIQDAKELRQLVIQSAVADKAMAASQDHHRWLTCQRTLLQHVYHAQLNRAAMFAAGSAHDLLRRPTITPMIWDEISELMDKHLSALADLAARQHEELNSPSVHHEQTTHA